MNTWIIVTLVFLVGLLVAEAKESQLGKWLTKPIASTGFVLTAYAAGAFQTHYGIAVFVALVLSWFGDVFLIPQSRKSFLFGLVSFLLGHLAFGVAFALYRFNIVWAGVTLAVTLLVGVVVGRWLKPHVEANMWKPVVAYILVISSMLITSVAAYPGSQIIWIPVGATLFYMSDLAVARNRFVKPAFLNRLWGLPFYYVAQLILAYTCSLVS
ncbi:MAG: lysoplasmalogenase [Deltaproteobacteria bacterium]|nr:MAG: lysoplasmalogenase [Deltaproteobacteria bacterium]